MYFILFLFSMSLCSQVNLSKQEKENLKAFTKAYGYVKYFHPSDEAYELDWGKFAIYGADKVIDAKNNNELISILKELFVPVAPSINFFKTKDNIQFNKEFIQPDDVKSYKPTFWQHSGLGFGTKKKGNIYRSIRTNSYELITEDPSFASTTVKLDGGKYAGKKIKISAKCKYEGINGNGRLWMRVDRKESKPGFFNNMSENPIRKSDWSNYEIIGKVDEDAESVLIGSILIGDGQLFTDDFKFFVDDNGSWKEIQLENGDFENVKSKTWKVKKRGYSTEYVTDESNKDNHVLKIQFRADERKRKTKKNFETELKFGEYINETINQEVSCHIPLVLYTNKNGTYPKSDSKKLDNLNKKMKGLKLETRNLAFQYGNIINTWNVFQHFYPYFDVVNVNWNKELENAFLRCDRIFDSEKFLENLEIFTASLKDGHVRVSGETQKRYCPNFSWEWIEGKLIITKNNGIEGLKIGDEIVSIDGKPSKKYFKEIEKTISAPTQGWLNHRAKIKSLLGRKLSVLNLKTSTNKEVNVIRNVSYRSYYRELIKEKRPTFKEIEEGIYYLDIDEISIDKVFDKMSTLKKAKSIICDLRGYPNGNHELITYLLSKNDENTSWMQVPEMVYPDQKKSINYKTFGWSLKAKKEKLKAKIFFIIDGRAISYAESFMGFIEGYKLATIIGQPTAGTNGNVNPFTLPGNYRISWTGMKVVKHDGSQHHGIGILPNVYVEKTIQGVKEGRDEFLEKALELARK